MHQHSNYRSPNKRRMVMRKALKEIIVKNCPNMKRNNQVPEVQKVPTRHTRRNMPGHILNKLTKKKFKHTHKILKVQREK